MKFLTKGFFLLPFLLCYLFLNGQQAKVIDAITQEELVGVSISNPDKTRFSTTNDQGVFDLGQFNQNEVLFIQMMGYETLHISIDGINKQKKVIELRLDEKKLKEIILSIARTASQSKKIAEKVTVINKSQIEKAAPTTGAELLRIAPSVRIQKSQGGGGSPVLRGFEANRVLLVIDGVRMNNAIYRSGHLQNAITIDPKTIERVEVIFGSSSVGYGSDALGGVIHYYTKTPKINNAKTFSHGFSSNYQGATEAQNYHFETEASFKKWANYTSISYSQFGNIRMGKNRAHGYDNWGLVPQYSSNTVNHYSAFPVVNPDPFIQPNTGYKQLDIHQKYNFHLPKEKQLLVNLQFSTSSDIPRFDKLNERKEGELRFAEWNYGPQKRLLISPQFKLFPKKRFLYKGTITTALQYIEERRIQRNFSHLLRETQNEQLNVWSINGDFEMAKKEQSSIAYGFEWIANQVTSKAYSRELLITNSEVIGYGPKNPIPTRYPSNGSAYFIAALYGNYRLDISPKTTFSAGGRFTSTRLQADWNSQALIDSNLNRVRLQNEALTGSLSLSYRPNSAWRLSLLLSSGFRSPNIDDLGKIRENRGELLIPNTELKPEYIYNIDGGIELKPVDNKYRFVLRVFNSSLQNYIGRMPYSVRSDQSTQELSTIVYNQEKVNTVANTNLETARIYGLSFEGSLKLMGSLELNGNLTLTRASENQYIGPLPSILPAFGGLELTFSKNLLEVSLQHRFNSSKSPETFSNGVDRLEETPEIQNLQGEIATSAYAGSPAWSILSLYTYYQFNKSFKTRLSLENLFDLHYREFASGISAPGRSLNLGFELVF